MLKFSNCAAFYQLRRIIRATVIPTLHVLTVDTKGTKNTKDTKRDCRAVQPPAAMFS